MNRYSPSRINPLTAIAAVAMTTFTFVLAVGVPSSIAPTGSDRALLAAAKPATAKAIEVIVMPAIEVIGTRDTTVAERHSKQRG